MNKERYELRKKDFVSALARLEEALAQPDNEFIRDAVIQRFEFTYEMAWKLLKLALEEKDILVYNAKDTLSEALVQRLIDDGNGWSELHKRRNETSHTYKEETAKEVYAFVKNKGVSLFSELRAKLVHD